MVQLGTKKVKEAFVTVVIYRSVSLLLLHVNIHVSVKLLQHLCRKFYLGRFGFYPPRSG